MKIVNLIIGILIISISLSCSKKEEENPGSLGFYIDQSVLITMVNEDGVDLLDPQIESAYNSSKVKIFHLINNKKVFYYDNMLNAPGGYKTYNPYERLDSSYYVFCLLRTSTDGSTNEASQSTTYIEWNDNDTDTIKCQLYESDGYLGCTKVWCNGKVVWEKEVDSGERTFNLIK